MAYIKVTIEKVNSKILLFKPTFVWQLEKLTKFSFLFFFSNKKITKNRRYMQIKEYIPYDSVLELK